MTDAELKEWLKAEYPDDEIWIANGLSHAFLGVAERIGALVAVYDEAEVLKGLLRDGMSAEAARQHFDSNIAGAYIGEGTPYFMRLHPTIREKAECSFELERIRLETEHERNLSLKIATKADQYYQRLEAIRQSALGEVCSIVAEGPHETNVGGHIHESQQERE